MAKVEARDKLLDEVKRCLEYNVSEEAVMEVCDKIDALRKEGK